MKRLLGIAASAAVVLGLTGWAADRSSNAPLPPSNATLSINGIHGGGVGPSSVESFEWGMTVPMAASSTGSVTTGRAQFGNLRVTLAMDAAGPLLAAAAGSNRTFTDATLTIGATGSMKLSSVHVVSVRWAGSSTGNTTQVELGYGKIEWTVGKSSAGFDTRGNTTR